MTSIRQRRAPGGGDSNGLKDLMRWITLGRDHAYGGTLRGGFIPEGQGNLEEETAQIEQRKEQMWMMALESMETGWSFLQGLQGIGAPEGITLAGPNPVPTAFDFGKHLTQALEAL